MKAEFNEIGLLQATNQKIVFTNANSKSLGFERVCVDPLTKKYINAGYREFPAAVQFDTTNTGLKKVKKALDLLDFKETEEF